MPPSFPHDKALVMSKASREGGPVGSGASSQSSRRRKTPLRVTFKQSSEDRRVFMKKRPLLMIRVDADNISVCISFNLSVRAYRSHFTPVKSSAC